MIENVAISLCVMRVAMLGRAKPLHSQSMIIFSAPTKLGPILSILTLALGETQPH